ncbi:MAG TPA: FAD-dependent oxidoreductase [Solirubrobacterales bacterium]|nr:FAD-dependent oxidoreductase [Solirubrobacterales bacterium]
MKVTATGWWLAEAEAAAATAPRRPALSGDSAADLVIVGGGYTGMWAAWHALARAPGARIVILEKDRCGSGPSGRNGGFCESYWRATPLLRAAFGDEPARRLADASSDSVLAIGRWCEENDVDAWFDQSGTLLVATSARQESRVDDVVKAAADLGAGDRATGLDADAVRARCASPTFGRAAFVADFATVHPGRLALGLRQRLLEAGVEIFEDSPVRRSRRLPGGDLRLECASGSVTAPAGVLAINAATKGWRGLGRRLAVASSHMVVTEPVPDVLEELGWSGGESITDGSRLVHYFRTTRDHRIVFGWAGGRIPLGARLGGRAEIDPVTLALVKRDLVRTFPQLAGRAVMHGWGGPIDVSPNNLPQVDSVDGLHVGFGYTGNGVGPSHLVGRILASMALDLRDESTRLPIVNSRPSGVPPEPLAWSGGSLVRAALAHLDRRDADERRGHPAARLVAALPRLLGIRLGR